MVLVVCAGGQGPSNAPRTRSHPLRPRPTSRGTESPERVRRAHRRLRAPRAGALRGLGLTAAAVPSLRRSASASASSIWARTSGEVPVSPSAARSRVTSRTGMPAASSSSLKRSSASALAGPCAASRSTSSASARTRPGAPPRGARALHAGVGRDGRRRMARRRRPDGQLAQLRRRNRSTAGPRGVRRLLEPARDSVVGSIRRQRQMPCLLDRVVDQPGQLPVYATTLRQPRRARTAPTPAADARSEPGRPPGRQSPHELPAPTRRAASGQTDESCCSVGSASAAAASKDRHRVCRQLLKSVAHQSLQILRHRERLARRRRGARPVQRARQLEGKERVACRQLRASAAASAS